MDNAKGNKCWTTYAGLAALIALGVCIKCKLMFGLSNHGHIDIDAAIATVIMGVCNQNLPTMEAFEAACIEAIQLHGSRVLQVRELTSIPDYDSLYSEFNDGSIVGTDDVHVFRFEGIENCNRTKGENIAMTYKEDCRVAGWLPRPAYQGISCFVLLVLLLFHIFHVY